MSRSRFLIFYRLVCLLLIGFLVQCLPGGNGLFKRKNDSRTFRIGIGSDLIISPGDTVITSLVPNRFKIMPPYRWMYAINDHQVIYFPLPPKLRHYFSRVKPLLIDLGHKYPHMKLMNRDKKPGHIGLVGSLVAALMLESGKEFPFDLFFCNCKHYTEYLSRGKVEGGRWYKAMYHKMNKKCPLAAPLDANMLSRIYTKREFTLKNRKGRETHLKIDHWPSYIPNIPGH